MFSIIEMTVELTYFLNMDYLESVKVQEEI